MFHDKHIDTADCQSCHNQTKCDTRRQATIEYQGGHLDDSAERSDCDGLKAEWPRMETPS